METWPGPPSEDRGARPLGGRLDGRPEAGASRSDHNDVMFVDFDILHQKNLTSWMTPEATKRTYKSARPTMTKLVQAQNMWW